MKGRGVCVCVCEVSQRFLEDEDTSGIYFLSALVSPTEMGQVLYIIYGLSMWCQLH